MHVDENRVHNYTFATKLSAAGYKVGIFGKYLNSHDLPEQTAVDPGFDAWLVNGGGSYNNPFFHASGISPFVPEIKDGRWRANTSYGAAYTTSVVGNVSVEWIRHTVRRNPSQPFFAYIAPKAAHENFTPAPWYADTWHASWPSGAPTPPSYNCSMHSRADKVAHVAAMDMISAETASCIDETFKNRWRTLMSVDDAIAAVVSTTKSLGVYDNTYFMYSSDHGFQLGEMNLAMDKRNVYDFDIRIHLVASGPGIKKGVMIPQLATNVDLTPTWWGLAGIDFGANDVDGKSLVPLLIDRNQSEASLPESVARHLASSKQSTATWRDNVFIEYYFVGINEKCAQRHPIEAIDNNFIALRYVEHPSAGNLMYAEFQSGAGGQATWTRPEHFEFYEMDRDPWQLHNRYKNMNRTLRETLHSQVHRWLHCKGESCP